MLSGAAPFKIVRVLLLKGAKMMNIEYYKKIWKHEESLAHINGWDFSHIKGRYEEKADLPWNYDSIVRKYLRKDMMLLDYDTGGGEYLLSLGHPYSHTAATEGYPPNVKLCQEKLLPLGIDLRACDNPSEIPFEDNYFDIIINRHGDFDPSKIYSLLKTNGIFITQQVGQDNDRDLVEMVLPNTKPPYSHLYLKEQSQSFIDAGFEILESGEAYSPIRFYDIGAFVWFAHIIEWEFPDFSVDKCFEQLLKMQTHIEKTGVIEGTIHRYMIVARK